MTQNELKYLTKLLQKKYRTEANHFLIEGEKIVFEALQSESEIEEIFIENNSKLKFDAIIKTAEKRAVKVEFLKFTELSKICDSKTPQGIAALVKKQSNKISQSNFILAVENVQDPGNVGTIIRNCDWFGIEQIILSEDSVELYNPKLVRSTMGSVFHLNIFSSLEFYTDLILLQREGYKLICADLDGVDLKEFQLPRKTILVLCNESNGPSEKLLELNPEKVTIKKFGNAESLNVANASAVFLSEFAYRLT